MESGRKFVIGGNWKSNGSLASINTLINDTLNKAEFDESRLDVVVSPIAMHIATVKGMINPKI
jgi:triosephosphate isomerase